MSRSGRPGPEDRNVEYRFRAVYFQDFVQAIASLLHAKDHPDDFIRDCLLRDMVISYARPFSGNRGFAPGRHQLGAGRVPRERRPLHSELITIRDKLIAHSDLPNRNPRVKRLFGTVKQVVMDGPDYARMFELRDDIERLLTAMADAMQADMRSFADAVQHDE